MSDMLERAARAISDDHDPELWALTNENWKINKRGEARAALLAALDLTEAEAEAMESNIRRAYFERPDGRWAIAIRKVVVQFLKQRAQGETAAQVAEAQRLTDTLNAADVKDDLVFCLLTAADSHERDGNAATASLLREAAEQITDLSCEAFQTLPDEKIVMLLGGPEKADRAAEHARYVMRVATREAEVVNTVREYARQQQAMLEALAHLSDDHPQFKEAQGRVEAANNAYALVGVLSHPTRISSATASQETDASTERRSPDK